MESTLRRTWAEIDLDALAHNYTTLRRLTAGAKFLGVVKADAYGHGAIQVSRVLQESGADYLAVSSIDEAMELRDNAIDMPILILGHTPKEQVGKLIDYHITQAVTCQAKALEYSREAARHGGTLTIMWTIFAPPAICRVLPWRVFSRTLRCPMSRMRKAFATRSGSLPCFVR